jgi:hypothetical protein
MPPISKGSPGRLVRLAVLLAIPLWLAGAAHAAPADNCPVTAGTHVCALQVSSAAYAEGRRPPTVFFDPARIAASEDAHHRLIRQLWLVFPTSQLPAAAIVRAAAVTIGPAVTAAVSRLGYIEGGSDTAFRVGPKK